MLGVKKARVMVYVDGFNLYYGLRERGWRRYYWLNLQSLARNLLRNNQKLVGVKYFTARISAGDRSTPLRLREKMEAKRRRQLVFLEALETLEDIRIFEGHYLSKVISCPKCSYSWNKPEEKMTDVCIATELITDAFGNRYDTALILSGDSDLVPSVLAVLTEFDDKKIVIAFPPRRVSDRLKQVASAYFTIGEAKLRQSMFPDEIRKPDGYILKRPEEWKKNVPPRKQEPRG